MGTRFWLNALLTLALMQGVAGAREREVRLLRGNVKHGVWGTKEFSVAVNASGVAGAVTLRGKRVFTQMARLYTGPTPFGKTRGLRAVQNEGYGKGKGMSLEPPKMTTRQEKGARIFEFEHILARKEILDGKPLCKAREKLVIKPNGEIHVTYEFEWLVTMRWRTFGVYMLMDPKVCRNKEYVVIAGEQVRSGQLAEGPVADSRVRHLPFEQISIWTDDGPVHVVWLAPSRSTFSWYRNISLWINCPKLPNRGKVFKGLKDKFSYAVLLPVSQE